MRVHGYASYFNYEDASGDNVSPVAFDHWLEKIDLSTKMVPLLWGHENPPIGMIDEATITRDGLWIVATILPTSRPFVRDIFRTERQVGLSMGYECLAHDSDCENDKRVLTKIKLVEVSLVHSPMNDKCWAFIDRPRSLFSRAIATVLGIEHQ